MIIRGASGVGNPSIEMKKLNFYEGNINFFIKFLE